MISSFQMKFFFCMFSALIICVVILHTRTRNDRNNFDHRILFQSEKFLNNSMSENDQGFYKRIIMNMNLMSNIIFDEDLKFHNFQLQVLGLNLTVKESILSGTSNYVAQEINGGEYSLMDLKEGDYIPPYSTVIDIGTNAGITAVTIAKLFPTVKVIGIEPIPFNYAVAVTNAALNGVNDRVFIINAALSHDVSKPIFMHYSIENPGCSTSHRQNFLRGKCGKKGQREFSIYPVTLEEIFNHFSIKSVPFIKMDCEGCEYDVLMNLPPHILKIFKNAIVLGEVHASVMRIPTKVKEYTHGLFSGYTQEMCDNCKKVWIPPHKQKGKSDS